MIKLHSQEDPSVNTVAEFESRFVVREDTAIIYLSSFKGCDRACRMCHLTQMGETSMVPATLEDFVKQAETSLRDAVEHYRMTGGAPKRMHFNFMARGEPFLNETVMKDWTNLSYALMEVAQGMFGADLPVVFKISTVGAGIYERGKDDVILSGLTDLPFEKNHPDIYYSLYSTNGEFRRRWLPKAEDPTNMFRILSRYARMCAAEGLKHGGNVYIHSAFIRGHNDELDDIAKMLNAIRQFPAFKRFNIVRFNSPDPTKWSEPDEDYLVSIADYIKSRGMEVQMVSRVGTDIAASCGTFYPGINNELANLSVPD